MKIKHAIAQLTQSSGVNNFSMQFLIGKENDFWTAGGSTGPHGGNENRKKKNKKKKGKCNPYSTKGSFK